MKTIKKARLLSLTFLVFGLLSFWSFEVSADFYVIPVAGKSLLPSQIVEFYLETILPGEMIPLRRVNPDGSTQSFTVPDGYVLVITSSAAASSQKYWVMLAVNGIDRHHLFFDEEYSGQNLYVPGIVIPSGSVVQVINTQAFSVGGIYVKGYLTQDR